MRPPASFKSRGPLSSVLLLSTLILLSPVLHSSGALEADDDAAASSSSSIGHGRAAGASRALLESWVPQSPPPLSMSVLLTKIAALEAAVSTQGAQIAQLKTRIAAQESKTTLNVKRLCVGSACLQPTGYGGEIDDGAGRLFIVGKNNGAVAAEISTNRLDPDVMIIFPTRAHGSSFFTAGDASDLNYYFFNTLLEMGVSNHRWGSANGGTLSLRNVCVGPLCLRPSTRDPNKVVFSDRSNPDAKTVAIGNSNALDNFQVFPGGNALGNYWFWNKLLVTSYCTSCDQWV